MELNWVREFNRLFEAINQNGSPTYFSGSKFIGIIREFDPTFADYNQFIACRQKKGLSTSRKNYYYDILMMFSEEIRKQIIERMWEEVESLSKQKKRINIERFFYLDERPIIEQQEPEAATELLENPTVFISYSWDNEEHKNWILGLATKLAESGVDVILDRWELGPGKNMLHFMDNAIKRADKVVIIFTPNYKLKADKREGGVGYEYSILNTDLYKTIAANRKYIPVLKEGDIETSIPDFIQQFIAITMTDNYRFDEKINELLLAIYDKPQMEKPKIGKRPDFL